MRKPDQKTVMFMCRDNKNLYIAVKCSELERKHLISDSAKIWGHDAVDISFAPLPRSSNKFHKFVINYKNEVYQASFPHNRKQSKWLIATATSRTKNEWIIEMEIPLKYLKLKGGEMAFNLLRYRPDASGTPAFSWSLIPIYSYCDPKWFGSIIL